jgi:hypothetical protein
LHRGQIGHGKVVDALVETEPTDGAAHLRVRERRAVAVKVRIDVVVRGQKGDVVEPLKEGAVIRSLT